MRRALLIAGAAGRGGGAVRRGGPAQGQPAGRLPRRQRQREDASPTRATKVSVGGRRCTAGDGTALAALVRSKPGRLRLHDFGSCSPPRARRRRPVRPRRSAATPTAARTAGSTRSAGARPRAGAADPGGPFGRGRLRSRPARHLVLLPHARRRLPAHARAEAPTPSRAPWSATVRGYDDARQGRRRRRRDRAARAARRPDRRRAARPGSPCRRAATGCRREGRAGAVVRGARRGAVRRIAALLARRARCSAAAGSARARSTSGGAVSPRHARLRPHGAAARPRTKTLREDQTVMRLHRPRKFDVDDPLRRPLRPVDRRAQGPGRERQPRLVLLRQRRRVRGRRRRVRAVARATACSGTTATGTRAMRVPAIVGAFPEPVPDTASEGKRRPVRRRVRRRRVRSPARTPRTRSTRVDVPVSSVVARRARHRAGRRACVVAPLAARPHRARRLRRSRRGPSERRVRALLARTAARSTCSTRAATSPARSAPATAPGWWRRCARAPTSWSGS